MYYRGAAAAIIVYDITVEVFVNSETFIWFYYFKMNVSAPFSGCCVNDQCCKVTK